MILVTPQTLLVYVGGVASTVAGSYLASKIRLYHDARKAHLDDLKEKVLVPLNESLMAEYRALVTHKSAVVNHDWGVRERKEAASVTEYPAQHGVIFTKKAPDIRGNAESSLYLDARKKHFPDLILHMEIFLSDWLEHADACYAWVAAMSNEILERSQLPGQLASHGSPYVMHQRLSVFLYRRLFDVTEHALFKRNPDFNDPTRWLIEGYDGTLAEGSQEQMDKLLLEVEAIAKRQREVASTLKQQARTLEKKYSSLCAEFSYSIAIRRLPRQCNLVSFF